MRLLVLYLALAPSLGCASVIKSSDPNLSEKVIWVGKPVSDFYADINRAFVGLRKFAGQYGWNQPASPDFIKEIRHFESKELFDSELRRLSDGQMNNIPATYVALMDSKVLRVVSWSAYRAIHPDHAKSDYIRVIQHELAHQLHVDLVGDQNMGPTWFFEGFAVVAASQYENTSLPDSEIEKTIRSGGSGIYPNFGFVVRHLMRRHTLPQLVEWARLERKQFLELIGYSTGH